MRGRCFWTTWREPVYLLVNVNGVPITILSVATYPRVPTDEEQHDFLSLFDDAYARFKMAKLRAVI